MSFSVDTKNEMAHIQVKKKCCSFAELTALIKMDGTIQISGEHRVSLQVTTENAAVARRIFSFLKNLFNIHTEIMIQKKNRLKKNNIYLIRINDSSHVRFILSELGIMDQDNRFVEGIPSKIITKECCRRAYLRGVFLGGGSVNNPEGTYHLEILTNNQRHSEDISDLMMQYNLSPRINPRKHWFVVYLKGSEEIIELLNIMGAHSALLNFENIRIYKDMRNQVNRLVNCETANLSKTVDAAMRQIENINLIASVIGMDNIPKTLRDVAEARLEYPDVSLKELGELMDPKVSKSGINHRMRKLERISEEIRDHKPFI